MLDYLLNAVFVLAVVFFLFLLAMRWWGSKEYRYEAWKKRARRALAQHWVGQCHYCKQPIFPRDFIAIGYVNENGQDKEVYIHAGFHFSLDSMDAFCVSGAMGTAAWDGRKPVAFTESTAGRAMRTGQMVAK